MSTTVRGRSASRSLGVTECRTVGSYGSLPLPVLAECNKLTLLAEANPDKWHRVTYMPLLVKARFVDWSRSMREYKIY